MPDNKKEIRIRQLGLAAYLLIRGEEFIGHEDGHFIFKSVQGEREWDLEYFNTCCQKHDNAVMSLRKFIQKRS